jgi:hypothetical protein
MSAALQTAATYFKSKGRLKAAFAFKIRRAKKAVAAVFPVNFHYRIAQLFLLLTGN